MLFLTQIRARGFKSFADMTTLDFNHEMIGVVGPNGSGKSNIADAIRWTLGEQSTKSLRGSNMDDIVFSGSVDKPAADFAEVTLVFNNKKDTFSNITTDVVEVTRQFDKKKRESSFFINGEKCKLKDIQDIALETGLTKSSIAIISQGTISNFAEAKPEARRELFDEAAGVAKYKKRKTETLNKLLKAKMDLDNIKVITDEIGKRLPSLEKQAKKAEMYSTKIKRLGQIEVSILAKDLKIYDVRIKELRESKAIYDSKIKELSSMINLSQDEFNIMLDESTSSEKEIQELNQRFNEILKKISSLKVQKQEADNRESSSLDTSDKDKFKATQIKKTFDEKRIFISAEKDKNTRLQNALVEIREQYDYIASKYDEIYEEIKTIERKINETKLKIEFNENNQKMSSFSQANVSQFIVNNAKQIGGVIGTLLGLVSVPEAYQIAVSVVAAGPLNSIVMKTAADVKRALNYLKTNNIGRATFLPLDTLNPSKIQGPQRTIIEQMPGFVGFASELVSIKGEYQVALDYVLGTIIVVDTYDSAMNMAKGTNNRFNIVTLTGERILPHGAIIGGSIGRNTNLFENKQNKASDLEDAKLIIEKLEEKEKERTKELQDIQINKEKLRNDINETQTTIRISQDNIQKQISELNELSNEYRLLTGTSLIDDEESNVNDSESIKLSRAIAKLEVERDDIQIRINSLSASRNKTADRQREINETNSEKRKELDTLKDENSAITAELQVMQLKNIAIIERLATGYNLQADEVLEMDTDIIEDENAARQEVYDLTMELKEIGSVNLDSIEEYKQEKERFDYYDAQLQELNEAISKLESIILDIDISMETQFKKVVDDVNLALPDAFTKLFGGGTARLIYTDPDNILETGIDIQVNPPGKKISNLNLLSGGEKSLVALSVLFSILKVRPLPLVILDEAEAPLDPSNVERFAKYVKQFTANTQFIIVTHREGTMENCDVLFGVTMQTKGITKIVKIKLVEAQNMALNIQSKENNI